MRVECRAHSPQPPNAQLGHPPKPKLPRAIFKGKGKGGKGGKKGGRGTKRGRANAAHEADGAEKVDWEDQEAEYEYSDEEPQYAKRARETVEAPNSESEFVGIDWY